MTKGTSGRHLSGCVLLTDSVIHLSSDVFKSGLIYRNWRVTDVPLMSSYCWNLDPLSPRGPH